MKGFAGLPRRLLHATLGFLEPANHGWGFSSSEEEVFNFIFGFVLDSIDRRGKKIYGYFISLRTGSSRQWGRRPSIAIKPGLRCVNKNTHLINFAFITVELTPASCLKISESPAAAMVTSRIVSRPICGNENKAPLLPGTLLWQRRRAPTLFAGCQRERREDNKARSLTFWTCLEVVCAWDLFRMQHLLQAEGNQRPLRDREPLYQCEGQREGEQKGKLLTSTWLPNEKMSVDFSLTCLDSFFFFTPTVECILI